MDDLGRQASQSHLIDLLWSSFVSKNHLIHLIRTKSGIGSLLALGPPVGLMFQDIDKMTFTFRFLNSSCTCLLSHVLLKHVESALKIPFMKGYREHCGRYSSHLPIQPSSNIYIHPSISSYPLIHICPSIHPSLHIRSSFMVHICSNTCMLCSVQLQVDAVWFCVGDCLPVLFSP